MASPPTHIESGNITYQVDSYDGARFPESSSDRQATAAITAG
jgi:hypothetical protein